MPTVLLTGATGYIASHTWLALRAAGFDVVGVDDFSNSSPVVLDRLHALMGEAPVFERGSVVDAGFVDAVFERHAVDAVVHFAAFKAVGESTAKPLAYYANNIGGLLTVCEAMRRRGSRRFVFSSSATVYGKPEALPITEGARLQATNPYGQTKLMMEQVLADTSASEPGQWRIARLRYFNPVGAHESGLIGEDPQDVPNNLMPYVAQVAAGQRPCLSVFGNDYPTPDGTGTRDYIHVMDLAAGHVAALRYLRQNMGLLTVNLGTGRPVSVLEMVRSFEKASGRPVPYAVVARRPGDVAQCWADPGLAERLLGWKAELDVDRMCADAWRWQNGMARSLLEESALATH